MAIIRGASPPDDSALVSVRILLYCMRCAALHASASSGDAWLLRCVRCLRVRFCSAATSDRSRPPFPLPLRPATQATDSAGGLEWTAPLSLNAQPLQARMPDLVS